jgi:hypothetical protein
LTQLQRRVVQEACQTAIAGHWDGKADEFLAARPRPGEWLGTATTKESLNRRWHDLTELAQACRARAEMARRGVDEDELDDLYELTIDVAAS